MNFVVSLLLVFSADSLAYTFAQVAKKVSEHPKVETLVSAVKATEEEGEVKSSWGDPRFGVSVRNLPKDTLANDQSPMSGTEYSFSQNIPLTTKYGNIERSYKNLAKSQTYDVIHQKRALLQFLWNFSIIKQQFTQDAQILKENMGWLGNMIKVSKRLYANGKTSQQAVLELKIRESELEAELSNKRHSLAHVEESLKFLARELPGGLDLSSVPWKVLEVEFAKEYPPNEKELALKQKVEASDLMLKAQKLSYVPDVTLSLAYIKRDENVDDFGDFVSAGVFFSLPLSKKEYAEADGAFAQKLQAQNQLKNYNLKRKSDLKGLEHEILKMRDELEIIKQKSLVFAKSSREITSKSYGLGSASYIELLQAELKYQNLLLRKNSLVANLAAKKTEYLFLRGDALYEE